MNLRDTRMTLLRPVAEDVTILDVQQQEIEARISQLNAEISEFNESREKELPLIQEVDIKIKELRKMISALNNQQMSLKAAFRKKKDAVKEIDEKISSAEFALVQSAQENASLHSKIVQSPDKLQNAERESMQSFHEKTAILEVYAKGSKKMSKHLKQMQSLQEQVNSAKQVEKDVKFLKVKNNGHCYREINKLMPSSMCEICGEEEETTQHLFFECNLAVWLWSRMGLWCNTVIPLFESVDDLFAWVEHNFADKNRCKIVKVIAVAVLRSLWNYRNELIFNSNRSGKEECFRRFQELSYHWLFNRSRVKMPDLNTWKCNTFSIL
ncbi:hypothetical protein LXL04_022556 [Taraxacum kok-saghyz]